MRENLTMTLLAVLFAVGVAATVLWLAPEQAHPAPEEECVQVALPDRGLPPCEGSRPILDRGTEVNV